MPKVKTTYAYKIQSIVKEFPDKFMESINNQLQAVLGLRRSRLTLFRGYERTP